MGTGDYKVGELAAQDAVLKDLDIGTHFLECTSAGTIATQSKQAYGTWEFDINKGADGNNYVIGIIQSGLTVDSGYRFRMSASDGVIRFQKDTGSIAITAASYIDINTDYRIKIARLKSEGVFKDIETLQVSDCENMPATYTYDNFTSNGRYGFDAERTSVARGIAGTADEISIVDTKKYLVEFDCQGTFTTSQTIRLKSAFNGTNSSNEVSFSNGRNSIILTSILTTTGVLEFKTEGVCDFTISGLTIRRIYDADTFAVFIKGGSFGDTETGWTLVDTTGGSGTNPVNDSTYTTSAYMVADLDAGDLITNIITTNEVEQ